MRDKANSMKKYVTKNIFLNSLACLTLGWLLRTEEPKPEPPTLGDVFRMEQGRDIEMRARTLYPGGLLIDDSDPESARKKTISAIENHEVSEIFGATFLVDGFVTKADVLQRVKGGWRLIEVKSSVADKPELVDDLAYTAMVAERGGLKVSESTLILISKDFRLGMSNDRLFERKDHTDEVQERVALFKPYWDKVKEATRAPSKPEPWLRFACKKCEFFTQCMGAGIKNHIFEIPRLSEKKYDELAKRGIVSVKDIPDSFELTEIQSRVRECVKKNQPAIRPELTKFLGDLSWPVYYLDFETVSTAVPLYADIAPYEAVPVQYSVHKCPGPGRDVEHYEFLSDPSRDCRKELAENLISTLGEAGSIVVYGSIEKTMLSNLANACPAFSGVITSLIGRTVNLERIFSTGFSHPDFHGSTSMKNVLPALVPEISYDALEIKEGNSAMAAFAYLALGTYKGEKADEVKKNLKAYCAQDTLALYKVHQRLIQVCSKLEHEAPRQGSLGRF